MSTHYQKRAKAPPRNAQKEPRAVVTLRLLLAPPVEGATWEDLVDVPDCAAAAVVLVTSVPLLVTALLVEADDPEGPVELVWLAGSVVGPEGEDEADKKADEDEIAGDVCCDGRHMVSRQSRNVFRGPGVCSLTDAALGGWTLPSPVTVQPLGSPG